MDMVSHNDERGFESDVKFHVLTALLVLVVRRTSYMPSCDSTSNLNDDELFLATLINHLLRIQSFNTHPVLMQTAATNSEAAASQVGLVRMGNAINVKAGSVMNHSCNPNTIRINCQIPQESSETGGVMTLYVASRNIGEYNARNVRSAT